MKNITKTTLISIASLLTISTGAEAASFTYPFTSPTGNSVTSPLNLTSTPPGFPGTITSFKALSTSITGAFSINSSTGLGVSGDPANGNIGRSDDGMNDEGVRINIPATPSSPTYELKSVTYSQLVTLAAGRSIVVTVLGGLSSVDTIPGNGTVASQSYQGLIGNSFNFFVGNSSGRFRLLSATFETVAPPVTEPPTEDLPEPLTILGTSFAVAALPALKKAHKKVQKKIS